MRILSAAALMLALHAVLWPANKAEAQGGKGLETSTFADIVPPGLEGGCVKQGEVGLCMWADKSFGKVASDGTTFCTVAMLQTFGTAELAQENARKSHIAKKWGYSEIRTSEISELGDWGQEVNEITQGWSLTEGKYRFSKAYAIDFSRDCYLVLLSVSHSVAIPKPPEKSLLPFPEDTVVLPPDKVNQLRTFAAGIDRKLKEVPCGASPVMPVVCKVQPPVSKQVDHVLDLVGAWFSAYANAAPAPWWPVRTPGLPADAIYRAWAEATQLARAKWQHAEALLTLNHRGQIAISHAQNQRLKAYAYWASWIIRRGAIFDEAAYRQWEAENPKPVYPLTGADAKSYYESNFVEPPRLIPLLYEKSPDEIWVEERWPAFIDSLKDAVVVLPLSVVDFFYTRGFAVALYYSYRSYDSNNPSIAAAAPLAMTLLFNTPVGPPLVLLWSLYLEASEFQEHGGVATGETSYRTVFEGGEFANILVSIETMFRNPRISRARQ